MSCEKCQRLGKAAECTHMASVIPPWKSQAKFDMVKSIYGDRKDLLARESMGQITNDAASVFSQGMVEKMLKKSPWVMKNKAKFVFLGVDPNGGGDSQMAIVTMVMEMNNLVFTGFECSLNHHLVPLFEKFDDALDVGVIKKCRGYDDTHYTLC